MNTNPFFERFEGLAHYAHLPGVQVLQAASHIMAGGVNVTLSDKGFKISFPATYPEGTSNEVYEEAKDRIMNRLREVLLPFGGNHLLSLHEHSARWPGYRKNLFRDNDTYTAIMVDSGNSSGPGVQAVTDFIEASNEASVEVKNLFVPIMKQMAKLHLDRHGPQDPQLEELFSNWREQLEKGQVREGEVVGWRLATDQVGRHDQDSLRKIVAYRMQASLVYAAVEPVLREPAITALIDQGKPINDALATRLGASKIARAEIRRIGQEQELGTNIYGKDWGRTNKTIRHLCLYDEPISRWESFSDRMKSDRGWAAGRQPNPGYHAHDWHYVSPVFATQTTEILDVVRAFQTDAVMPLMRMVCGQEAGKIHNSIGAYAFSDRSAATPDPRYEAAIDLLRTINKAIIGNSQPTGFAKAAMEVHRFTASLAALRQEVIGDTPAWPALFPAWKSEDGRFEILPLTSAANLVEEGLAMEHCVGGYDNQCRTGRTHIFSVRVAGQREATLEVKLDFGLTAGGARMHIGQCKGRLNQNPVASATQAVKEFMAAIEAKEIKPRIKAVLAYQGVLGGQSEEMQQRQGMDAAQAEGLWGVYRDFLIPNATPTTTLLQWAQETGVIAAMERYRDATVEAVSRPSQANDNRETISSDDLEMALTRMVGR